MTTDAAIDLPDFCVGDYMHVINDTMQNHPRSLQKRIGPSELGTDCVRTLIHKLAGDKPP